MNYDPNMTNSGRMAKQTVKLTFQLLEYKAEMIEVVGGNCTGMTVIDCAVDCVYSKLPDYYGRPCIIMKDADGNTFQCVDEDDRCEEWLKDMLVRAEITAIEKSA